MTLANASVLDPKKARRQKDPEIALCRKHFVDQQGKLKTFTPLEISLSQAYSHWLGCQNQMKMYASFRVGVCFNFLQTALYYKHKVRKGQIGNFFY